MGVGRGANFFHHHDDDFRFLTRQRLQMAAALTNSGHFVAVYSSAVVPLPQGQNENVPPPSLRFRFRFLFFFAIYNYNLKNK